MRLAVPELPALLVSPPYIAVTVREPATEPVTVTLQLPPESEQDAGENATLPPPLCIQVIVPVGLLPVTVAVHAEAEHETVTLVEPGVIVRGLVPELPTLFVSPGYDAWTVTPPTICPVTVTEQLVPDKLQVVEENETVPVPDCDQVIVSPEIGAKSPVMVAVQEVPVPAANDDDVHVTVVVVIA